MKTKDYPNASWSDEQLWEYAWPIAMNNNKLVVNFPFVLVDDDEPNRCSVTFYIYHRGQENPKPTVRRYYEGPERVTLPE